MASLFDVILERKYFYLYWKDKNYYLAHVSEISDEEPNRMFLIHFYGYARTFDLTITEQDLRHPTGDHQPLEYTLDNFLKIFAENSSRSPRQLGIHVKNDGTYELIARTTPVSPRKAHRSHSVSQKSASKKPPAARSKTKSPLPTKPRQTPMRSSTRIRKPEKSHVLETDTPRPAPRQQLQSPGETPGDQALRSPTVNVSQGAEAAVLPEKSNVKKTKAKKPESKEEHPTPSETPKRTRPVRKRNQVVIADDSDLDFEGLSLLSPVSVSKEPARTPVAKKKKSGREKSMTSAVTGPPEAEMPRAFEEESEKTAAAPKGEPGKTEHAVVKEPTVSVNETQKAVVGGRDQAVVIGEKDNNPMNVCETIAECAVSASDQKTVLKARKQQKTSDKPTIPTVNGSDGAQLHETEESLPTAEEEEYFDEEPMEEPSLNTAEEDQMTDHVFVDGIQKTGAGQEQVVTGQDGSVFEQSGMPSPGYASTTDQDAWDESDVRTVNGTECAEAVVYEGSDFAEGEEVFPEELQMQAQSDSIRFLSLPPPDKVLYFEPGYGLVTRPSKSTASGNNQRIADAASISASASVSQQIGASSSLWRFLPAEGFRSTVPKKPTCQTPEGQSNVNVENNMDQERDMQSEFLEWHESYLMIPKFVGLQNGSDDVRQSLQLPWLIQQFINEDIDRCEQNPNYITTSDVKFKDVLAEFFKQSGGKPYQDYHKNIFYFWNLNGNVLFTPAERRLFRATQTGPGKLQREYAIGWNYFDTETKTTRYLLDILNLVHVFRMLNHAPSFIAHNQKYGGVLPADCDAIEFFKDFATYVERYCIINNIAPTSLLQQCTPGSY